VDEDLTDLAALFPGGDPWCCAPCGAGVCTARDAQPPGAVLWLDPGKSTGWALLARSDSRWCFCAGQVGDVHALDPLMARCVIDHRELWVGWESYVVAPGGGMRGTAHWALTAIGVLQEMAASRHGAKVLPAAPAWARIAASPDVLRALGWYPRGMEHAQQAARHLVMWLHREGYLKSLIDSAFTQVLGGSTFEGKK
jgi:hypothetical protein